MGQKPDQDPSCIQLIMVQVLKLLSRVFELKWLLSNGVEMARNTEHNSKYTDNRC